MSLREVHRWLDDNRLDMGLFVLRLGACLFMALGHGLTKLRGFSRLAAVFPDPLGIGSVGSLSLATGAELLAALLLAIGLFARPSAVVLAFTMAVAGLLQHAPDPFAKKELALLYGIAFLALAFTGPGIFSMDGWLSKKRPKSGSSLGESAPLAAE